MKPQTLDLGTTLFSRCGDAHVKILQSGFDILLSVSEITALYQFLNAPDVPEPPIVDWSAMPKWAQWVAMDESGEWHWYTNQPIREGWDWVKDPDDNGWRLTGIIIGPFTPQFTGDWKDSLVERPKETPRERIKQEASAEVKAETIKMLQEIHPNAIAPGHNPDNLTNAQVGVADGWRLLNVDEIKDGPQLNEIQGWCTKKWNATNWGGSDPTITYRTKLTPKQLSKKRSQ